MIKKLFNKLLGKKQKSEPKKEKVNPFSKVSKEEIQKLQLNKLSDEELDDLFVYSFLNSDDDFFHYYWVSTQNELDARKREKEGILADKNNFDMAEEIFLYHAMKRDDVEVKKFSPGNIDDTEILYSYKTSGWKADLYMQGEFVGKFTTVGSGIVTIKGQEADWKFRFWIDELVREYYEREYDQETDLLVNKYSHKTGDWVEDILRITAEMYLVDKYKDNCILIRHREDNSFSNDPKSFVWTKCWLNKSYDDYKKKPESFAKAVYSIESSDSFMIMNDFYKNLKSEKIKWDKTTKINYKEKLIYEVTEEGKVKVKKRIHLRRVIEEKKMDLAMIDVSEMTEMSRLFRSIDEINGSIANWDVSKVTSMFDMFASSSINPDLSKWNVSNVKDMGNMFNRSKFNSDISKWNVSKVDNMDSMFEDSIFNDDISNWDVSSVLRFGSMFCKSKFNRDISKWDVSKAFSMLFMFKNSKFTRNIRNWDVPEDTSTQGMFTKKFSLSDDPEYKDYFYKFQVNSK